MGIGYELLRCQFCPQLAVQCLALRMVVVVLHCMLCIVGASSVREGRTEREEDQLH